MNKMILTALCLFTVMSSTKVFSEVTSPPAFEAATIKLTPPTKRENGVALKPDDIKHYIITATSSTGKVEKITIAPSTTATVTKQWFPSESGTYKFSAVTVDTGDRTSKPTPVVSYTPKPVIIEVAPPEMPGLDVIIGGEAPPEVTPPSTPEPATGDEVNGIIKLNALDFVGGVSSPSGGNWSKVTIKNVQAVQAPGKEFSKPTDPTKDARLDYRIKTTGGKYEFSVMGYAVDGLTDSLYVGINGAPISGDTLQAVFASNTVRSEWLQSTPVTFDLKAGEQILSIFRRDVSYAISSITLKKL